MLFEIKNQYVKSLLVIPVACIVAMFLAACHLADTEPALADDNEVLAIDEYIASVHQLNTIVTLDYDELNKQLEEKGIDPNSLETGELFYEGNTIYKGDLKPIDPDSHTDDLLLLTTINGFIEKIERLDDTSIEVVIESTPSLYHEVSLDSSSFANDESIDITLRTMNEEIIEEKQLTLNR